MDWGSGSVVSATDALPGFGGLKLREYVQNKFKIRTVVINDAVAALIGETYALPEDSRDGTLMLTLGTGLGVAMMNASEPLDINSVSNPDTAHIIMREGGKLCACGKRGCIEQYVSATAIKENNGGKKVFFSKVRLSETERKAVNEFIDDFITALDIIILSLKQSRIIVGGGIIEAKRHWLADFEQKCKDKGITVPIFAAKVGNYAGLLGATYAALNGKFGY